MGKMVKFRIFIKKIRQVTLSLFTLGIVICILKFLNWNIGISFSYIPTIREISHELYSNFTQIEMYQNIAVSLKRVYCGFGLAVLLAIPLAVIMVEYSKFKYIIYPALEIIRPIPNVAWVPLSIILFKTIGSSVLFITFVGAFFPVLINTIEGLENINVNYLKIAHSFQVKRVSCIFNVKLPAAAPAIYTGLLTGMSGSWLGVVVAEMISGQSGIGYFTWVNYTLVNIPGVIICMITIGTLGAFSSWIIRQIYAGLHLVEGRIE